jgi:2-polyprenyl-3-methyl-5-hydroxy-6-metoxy-1,4-benzoquinol methylase
MNLTNEDLVHKYNEYFRADPEKWSGEERDKFCFEAVRTYQNIENILDLGCGNGHLLRYIADRWGQTAQYAGLDFSPVACELARKKVPEADIRCGLIEDTDFGHTFDAVVLLGVIEHLDMEDIDHKESLAAIKRFMSPNGILYIEAPNCIAYKSNKFPGVESFHVINQGNRQFEWHLLRSTWERIFEKAGLEIVESIEGPAIQWQFIWTLQKCE